LRDTVLELGNRGWQHRPQLIDSIPSSICSGPGWISVIYAAITLWVRRESSMSEDVTFAEYAIVLREGFATFVAAFAISIRRPGSR
jgi:hypothetical protein